MQLIREKYAAAGKEAPSKADMRFGFGSAGQVFILNKRDGIIRQFVAGS